MIVIKGDILMNRMSQEFDNIEDRIKRITNEVKTLLAELDWLKADVHLFRIHLDRLLRSREVPKPII